MLIDKESGISNNNVLYRLKKGQATFTRKLNKFGKKVHCNFKDHDKST